MIYLFAFLMLLSEPGYTVEPDSARFESLLAQSRQYYITHPDTNRLSAEAMVQLGESSGDAIFTAHGYKWLGIYHHMSSNYVEALGYYRRAADMFEMRKDTLNWIEGLLSVAIIQLARSNFEPALEQLFQSVELAQATSNIRLLSRAYSEIAKILSLRGDHEGALPYFEQFLAISIERDNAADIAMAYGYLGTVHTYLGNWALGIENLLESASRYEERGDFRSLARTYQTLGNGFKNLQDPDQAARYYQQSIAAFERLNDTQGLGIGYYNLGVLYFEQGNYLRAEELLARGIRYSTEFGHTELIILGYQKLSDTYAATSKFRQAYEAFSNYFAYHDSLNNRERRQALDELQTRFETREKEQTIELQRLQLSEQELTIQRNRIMLSALMVLVVLLLVGWLLWQSKVQQRELRLRVDRLEMEQRLQLERERISRDLHDHVGAQLVNMLSGLDLAGRYSGAGKPDESMRIMHSLKDEARTTIRQLRDTIWTLNVSEITPEAFFVKLDAYIKQVIQVTALQISLENTLPESAEFTPSQALNTFRIIQEALQNTLKYAGATQVTVSFSSQEDQLLVCIVDNGCFLERTSDDPHIGSGLKNMQKRAGEIGGELEVLPSKAGTTIRMTVPRFMAIPV